MQNIFKLQYKNRIMRIIHNTLLLTYAILDRLEMQMASIIPTGNFRLNRKGAVSLASMILLIFTVIAFGATYPTIVDTIQGVQSGGWNFTGSDGAKVIYSLIPFIVLGAFVISIVRDMLGGSA